jgi:hypothetical protein
MRDSCCRIFAVKNPVALVSQKPTPAWQNGEAAASRKIGSIASLSPVARWLFVRAPIQAPFRTTIGQNRAVSRGFFLRALCASARTSGKGEFGCGWPRCDFCVFSRLTCPLAHRPFCAL